MLCPTGLLKYEPQLIYTDKTKWILLNYEMHQTTIKSRIRILQQYLDKVTLDLSKGWFST